MSPSSRISGIPGGCMSRLAVAMPRARRSTLLPTAAGQTAKARDLFPSLCLRPCLGCCLLVGTLAVAVVRSALTWDFKFCGRRGVRHWSGTCSRAFAGTPAAGHTGPSVFSMHGCGLALSRRPRLMGIRNARMNRCLPGSFGGGRRR